MKVYLTTPEGYMEKTTMSVIHRLTGLSISDIFHKLKEEISFSFNDYHISQTKKSNHRSYIATNGKRKITGASWEIGLKIGSSGERVTIAAQTGHLIRGVWKIKPIESELFACLWDGKTKHKNITRAELIHITGRKTPNLIDDSGMISGWVYSRNEDLNKDNVHHHVNFYSISDDRMMFDTMVGLIKRNNLGTSTQNLLYAFENKGYYKENGVKIFRGTK